MKNVIFCTFRVLQVSKSENDEMISDIIEQLSLIHWGPILSLYRNQFTDKRCESFDWFLDHENIGRDLVSLKLALSIFF